MINESGFNRECEWVDRWFSAFSKHTLEWYARLLPSVTSSEKKAPAKKPAASKSQSSGLLIGYARVSTQDQNLELQTEALHKAGCKKIFEDRVSGTRAERPGLTQAREGLRAGDTLVVWKLDRLGRTGGRKRQMTEIKVKAARKLLASGVPARDVASNLGVSVPTLYRWVPASTSS